MNLQKKEIVGKGIKFLILDNSQEIARAYLYILTNDLHQEPFGLLEDVYVQEDFRGKGYGTTLTKAIIQEAKSKGCYKLICTSRHQNIKVHKLYQKLGFRNQGIEFRIDF
jgi:GNAT superfamily N-acetyltransferase